MDWKDFVAQTLHKLRQRDPRATLKHAMIAAKEPYRRLKENLFSVRGDIVEGERHMATSAPTPQSKKKRLDRADRVEAVQYGEVLRDMRYGGFDYLEDDFNISR